MDAAHTASQRTVRGLQHSAYENAMQHVFALSFDKRILSHLNSSGIIQGVNSQCTYLIADDGWLIGISPVRIGNGARLILTDHYGSLRAATIEKARVALGPDFINIPGRVCVDLSCAEDWTPNPVPRMEDGWQSRCQLAQRVLDAYGNHSGQPELGQREIALVAAVGAKDWVCATQVVNSLVGLGPGLTPAGDDFLAGYFGALHQVALHYRTLPPELLYLKQRMVASLAGRTHPVSEALTTDFVEGFTSDVFQNALSSIARRCEEREIRKAVQKTLSIGATSGTEMLRGLLFAFESISPSHSG